MTELTPDSLPARLALLVARLNRRLVPASGGLSHGLLMSLASVAKRGPLRLAELAQFEEVSAPGATRIVAELENRGLVTRGVDPADGRAVLITVTAAGMEAILRARAARAQVMAQLLEGLSPSELGQVEAALPALEKAIELF
jgi:DNA-binding MarR family transcriptional regulator